MQKAKDLSNSTAMLLDNIGGESLKGSGFESEVAEAEFVSDEISRSEQQAATGD